MGIESHDLSVSACFISDIHTVLPQALTLPAS